jgi:type II secretory pathway pseudopilin PulG
MRRRSDAGFSLVELLTAVVLLVIFMIGILSMLDRSRALAKRESALSDTQENVRYAAYHLLRMARMTGGAGLPLADGTGTPRWISGAIVPVDSGTFDDGFGTPEGNALNGSDGLILRGFFEQRPYFLDNDDFDDSSDSVTVVDPNDPNAPDMDLNRVSGVLANEFQGNGVVFMGRGSYAVAEVQSNTASVDYPGDREEFVITFQSGVSPWESFNPGGTFPAGIFPFEVYRAGFLDSYGYFVTNDHVLMRTRNGANPEPVAINIGNLQVALGIDANDDGDLDPSEWLPAPTAADGATGTPVALRITVLGRTPDPMPDWVEPADTFNAEDLDITTVDRSAKWRRMQVVAMLRDFQL